MDWQIGLMAPSSVTPYLGQPFNIHLYITAQITLNFQSPNMIPQSYNFCLSQILNPCVRIDPGLRQSSLGGGLSNAKDISERYFNAFVAR
jgi:hypothetical protein